MNEQIQASVTTETIVHNPGSKVRHSHGPNFGRYVAGCGVCAEKYPDGAPPKAARRRTKEPKPPRVPREPRPVIIAPLPAGTMTNEQMMALLQQQQTQLMEFATEMRKPDPEVLAEREAAKARLIQMRKQNAEAARIEIEQRDRRQNSCSHKMPRGENAISGQIHSDGLMHPLCVVCQKEFAPYKPHAEQMQMGVA